MVLKVDHIFPLSSRRTINTSAFAFDALLRCLVVPWWTGVSAIHTLCHHSVLTIWCWQLYSQDFAVQPACRSLGQRLVERRNPTPESKMKSQFKALQNIRLLHVFRLWILRKEMWEGKTAIGWLWGFPHYFFPFSEGCPILNWTPGTD